MKINDYRVKILTQQFQDVRGSFLQTKRTPEQISDGQPAQDFFAILGKSVTSPESNPKPESIPTWNQNRGSLLKSLAINHLRSRVGETTADNDVSDIDKNCLISFNDIGKLTEELNYGRFDRGFDIAVQGIRSRVGQEANITNNEIFDLNRDGVISMADIAHFREQMRVS